MLRPEFVKKPVALENKKQKKTKQDKIKLKKTKQAKQMFKCNNQGHCRTPTSTISSNDTLFSQS